MPLFYFDTLLASWLGMLRVILASHVFMRLHSNINRCPELLFRDFLTVSEVDGSSDVWAMACALHIAASGKHPYLTGVSTSKEVNVCRMMVKGGLY